MTRPPGIPSTWKDQDGKVFQFRFAWDYHAAAGSVIGRVARFDDAEGNKVVLPFFLPNGTEFKSGAAPEPRPLFNLDGLATAANTETVYVLEGEKCASALTALGFVATSSPGGALAASKANWGPLARYRRVVILPDVDQPGERYAADVCRALAAIPGAREIVVSRLPGQTEGADCVDWLRERLPEWDGFTPPPRETGDELDIELREAIEAAAEPVLPEWLTSNAAGGAGGPEPWTPPIPLDAADSFGRGQYPGVAAQLVSACPGRLRGRVGVISGSTTRSRCDADIGRRGRRRPTRL